MTASDLSMLQGLIELVFIKAIFATKNFIKSCRYS